MNKTCILNFLNEFRELFDQDPDIAPSDYHLFRSLQNSLNGVKLASKEACENHLKQFFQSETTEVLSR